MPVPMSSSFSQSCAKLDPENNSFSFTQLLMNGGDAWHDIDPDAARIPSVLPQSDFVVNPPNAADECVIRVPQPVSSTKDKKRKAPGAATKEKDMSCITTTPVAKASEDDDKNLGNSSKKQKSQHKDERPKAEPVRSGNTDNKGNKQGKENSKPSEAPKQDYIHVRARRGQATDSHSLAERVRREKISERMKLLQDLVPGCSKVTGKAMMLDEIINYVQSLQRQVEFLSMKLASVKPRLDLYQNTYLVNEVLPGQQHEAQALNGLMHDSHPQVWTTSGNTQIVDNCS